jgi:hypothetical protein
MRWETICADASTTPTCNSSTEHTRLFTRGPDRTAARTWPGITSFRCLRRRWRSGRSGGAASPVRSYPRRGPGSARGIGLPFIDYRRGDGPSVGPGTERKWTAVAIDEETPWLRDYRGLWGYDTRDPFGGKRAPAGPRYERDGSTRLAWDRPVAWAGLDKVPPTRADELTALQRRAGDVELELGAAEVRLADEIDRLRSLHEGMRSSQLRERTPQRATSPPRQRSRPPGTRSRACRPSRKRWRMLS